MKTALLFVFFLSGFPLKTAISQVVNTERGKVEFVGLKNWTVKMIEDSLAVHAPQGHGLWGCAAELVAKLRFADASVIRYSEGEILYSVITVVEPPDSGRIQYRPQIKGGAPVRVDYKPAAEIMEKDNFAYQVGLITYGLYRAGLLDSAHSFIVATGTDSTLVRRIWKFLSSKRRKADRELALWASLHDPNPVNRTIATAVLANFPGEDVVWWTLVEALRDREIMVNTAARQALNTMLKTAIKKVDWFPAANTLRFLLQGTNLFALPDVLETLCQTRVSKEIAPLILNPSPDNLIVAYLRAEHAKERELAHRLLARLSGKDFGYDYAAWQKWIEGLKRSE